MKTAKELFLGGLLCEECTSRIDGESPGFARVCQECYEDLNEDIIRDFHELKCHPMFFEDVKAGIKTFEIRFNDRDFKEGQGIRLKEYSPITGQYTGRDLLVEITYMTDFQQTAGFVVLGIKRVCY